MIQPLAARGVEQVRLVGTRTQRHPFTLLRRLAHLSAGDELGRLPAKLGAAEDERIGSDVLDDVSRFVTAPFSWG